MTPRCLADVFLDAVDAAPEQTALHRRIGERSLRTTYRELTCRVAAMIERLDRLGAGRVVCFLDDVFDAVHFGIASAHSGHVAVPLDPRSSRAAVLRLIERTDAVAVLTRAEHFATLGELPVPRLVCDEAELDFAAARALLESRKAAADSLHVIQPTSGTTGEPKLMLRTQRPFLRMGWLWRFAHADPEGGHQRRIMVHPLTHGTGVMDLWSGLAARGELCLPARPNVEASLAEIRALDPHVMTMVPRILRALHRQQLAAGEPADARLFGPSARVLSFGGASCEPELQALVTAQGVEVVEVYGTSETGILVMPPPGERRAGWAGKVLDDVEIKLDVDGELLAKTPVMMEGYLGDDQQTSAARDDDGFYRTGDYAELDDGWVKILGRKKDVFNTPTGNNIFPARIEGMLEQLAGVHQAVLLGDARPFLTALLVLEPGANVADIGREVRAINTRLEGEEQIRRWCVVEPALGTDLYRPVGHGKVRRERKLIEERFADAVAALYAAHPTSAITVVD